MTSVTQPYYYLKRYHGDPLLIIASVLLVTLGFLMMGSSSVEIGSRLADDTLYFVKRQASFLLLAMIIGAGLLSISMRFWYQSRFLILLASYFVLLIVLVPGISSTVNGSKRWLDFGLFALQASEPAKLGLVMYLSCWLSRYHEPFRASRFGFIKPLLIIFLPALLLLLEPDFGALVVLTVTVFGMMFLAGVRILPIIIGGIIVIALAGLLILSSDYRLQRVETFLSSLEDPFSNNVVFGSGYQLAQALIGFGRGELFGVGFGNSIQKIYFLPEAHTDFVLAIIAEELGAVGVLSVVFLFLILFWRIMLIGRRNEVAGRLASAYLCYGIALIFSVQTIINFAVNMGVAPTKGLTLPFISYGGSSLLICIAMLALVLRVDIEQQQEVQPRIIAGGQR